MNACKATLTFCFVALCCSSCAFRPAIDSQGNIDIREPSKLTRHLGAREFSSLTKNRPTTKKPLYAERVQRVATRLFSVIGIPQEDWEFAIFKDRSANAFCLPGGKIGVNTGLFSLLGDDDELLAVVLAHEISHATSNHAEQRMLRALAMLIGGAIVWHTTHDSGSNNSAKALAAYTLAAYLLDSLPFSRRQEYESDKIGAVFMAKAGYNPQKSIQLWEILQNHPTKHGHKKRGFLRTHPSHQKRIEALEAFMPTAMLHYHAAQAGK